MSQILEYFRSLFHPNINFTRKRRRTELSREEVEPIAKYKRVSNVFPKKYHNFIDDEPDYFREVRQRNSAYNELLGDFLMDQHQRQVRAVLEDGEFSDEEDFNSYRLPAAAPPKPKGFDFKRFYEKDQPSTSTSRLVSRKDYSALLNGAKSNGTNDDDDIQYVSTTTNQRTQSRNLPSLIPIAKAFQSNGLAQQSSLKPQPTRGRRSCFDFLGKNRAFPSSAFKVTNSVIDRKHQLDTKRDYEELLQTLIPRYTSGAVKSTLKQAKEPLQVGPTIDISDDSDEISKPQRNASYNEISRLTGSRSDFKKPTAVVDLSIDEDDIDRSQFSKDPFFASTPQIFKAQRESGRSFSGSAKKANETPTIVPILSPVNSLKEKQSLNKSLHDDAIAKIVEKFNQKREEQNRSITEEIINATKLERERIEHERRQQRRIDESITSALSDKCIIIDEEEDLIDEFPPLTDQQNQFVRYALQGSKQEVIVSKFNMNITRHDLNTLDGLNWLNDEVINFYMELIKERSEQVEHLPKVHVMNTFFLGKLLSQGHAGVRRWTRKIDIFSYDIIPIPVHVGGVHWCMSIIHFKNKTIRYYDSMGHPNHVVLEALGQYLRDESMDKKKVPFDMSDWKMECVRDCPQQKNGSDCGVFSCQFAEFISRDSNISFEQQHMPYFRRKMICEIGNGRLFLGY